MIGNPCNAATGNKYLSETDVVDTDGVPSFVRHYNTQFDKDLGLGFGWTTRFHRRLEVSSASVQVRRSDGRGEPFACSGGNCTGDADTRLGLASDGAGYTLTLPDGSSERYNTAGRLLSETDASGNLTGYAYDGNGKLISVTGPFGHVLTLAYNAAGRLASVTDPAGSTHSYGYDGNGNLVTVTRPDGSLQHYHYDNAAFPHHLTGITDENGARSASYAYDGNGKAVLTEQAGGQERFTLAYNSTTQTTVTDAVGTSEVLAFAENLGVKNLLTRTNQADGKGLVQTFDARNNLTCRKDAEGRVTTYSYNATNQRLSKTEGQTGDCASPVTTATTRTTSYQYLSATLAVPTVIESPSVYPDAVKRTSIAYDGNRNPATITRGGYTPGGSPISRTTNLSYNAQGQVVSMNGPRTDLADLTTLSYYDCASGGACGQLKTLTNALGQVTSFDAYDANGRLLQKTDPSGLKTVYAYDSRGRLTSVSRTASGGTARNTQSAYDAAGQPSQVSLPDGRSLAYAYDAAHQLTSVTDNLGNRIEYAYDLKGNRIQTLTKDPDGTLVRSLETAYDLRNRVSQLNEAGSLTQQVHDAVGNLVQATDPNNNPPTTHEYDALDRLLKTVDALGGNTSFGHDPNGEIAQVIAANGATTNYETDDLGNRLKEVSPDRGTLVYANDEAGNVKTATEARGITVQYSYDALNRITLADYPGTGEDESYSYDNCPNGIGRLCRVTDASGITEYAYDGFGNVLTQQRTESGISFTTGYSYDLADRVTAISYPDGIVVNYSRDALGRITNVSATVNGISQSIAANRSYRADGLLTGQSYGNGLTETRTYDLKGELTGQAIGSETWSYSYDANGNLLARSLPSAGTSYGYDALDRLGEETSPLKTLDYAYDGNGNRISLQDNGHLTSYGYTPSSNRLLQAGSDAIQLDQAGNTVSDGRYRYEYTNAGRLGAVFEDAEELARYRYNALNQRTSKTTPDGATVYHYDLDGRLLLETRADGQRIRAYVWAEDQPLAQIDRKPGQGQGKALGIAKGKAEPPANAAWTDVVTWLTADHLGTPRAGTNANAEVAWRWEGNAFGNTLPEEDPDGDHKTVNINLRFPGQYFDSESGLHYNWNRYYDPRTGRYITSDPIGLEGGLNSYLFGRANPLKWTDPRGLDTAGCDLPGGRFIRNPRVLECCALHDKCFDDHNCPAGSWWNDKQCNSEQCDSCNRAVRLCFIRSLTGPTTDDPNQPNYYCARLHQYISIPGDFDTLETAKRACQYNHTKDQPCCSK